MAYSADDTNTDQQSGALDPGRTPTGELSSRKRWITPQVIVSELRNAGAQVAVGSDGTSPLIGYQYGS